MLAFVRDYLGKQAKDRDTGFSGTCTAYVVYTSGFDRALLEGMDDTGRPIEFWVDVSRIEWLF